MKILGFVLGLLITQYCRAELLLEAGFIQALLPGQNTSAAFFTVTNRGEADCDLLAARGDFAGRTEFHSHQHRDGMVHMRAESSLPVPSRGQLVLEPGGYHLMLFDIDSLPATDSMVELDLDFGDCGNYRLQLPVRDRFQSDLADKKPAGVP